MKKFFFFLAAAIALIACQRESGITENTAPKTRTVTIQAGFEDTKTAYDEAGKFSWSAGDIIGVVCNGPAGQVVVPFTTQESGPVVTFTGELAEGLTLYDLASYPYTQTVDGYACNDFAYDPSNGAFRLWGSVKPSLTDPLSSMPLLGTKDADGFYQFKSAAGAVKFTVENVPIETAYAYLEVPADTKSTSNVNGWYAVSAEDGMIHMTSSIDPWTDRYNWNAPTDYNQTMEYWFFIPDGVLPAGTKFELCNSFWAAIESFTFKSDVQVVRNAVVNIEPIVLEATKVYTLEDIIGTYEMTVSAGKYSSNNEPGDLVLEASDDESKGNVMMTKFAGVSGKQYGTFDGLTITFPKNQIFGPNPYSDADTKPYVALDFYYGSVIDAVFDVLGKGKIRAFGATEMGLRSCTEADWAEYGGGWPWALCFSYVYAEIPSDDAPTDYAVGEILLNPTMITAAGTITYDGQGIPGLCDNNPATFWHSDYYNPVTDNDPVYGLWIDIALKFAVRNFHFTLQVRADNATAAPSHIIYGVSNDGVNWTRLQTEESLTSPSAGAVITLNNIDAGEAYKYIRLGITDSVSTDEGTLTGDLNFEGYKKCVNVAELHLYKD